ncbi:MAG: YARHG domain-containing protein [Crocinitomix sp.]|nr:YARHG domain-containing protein [Crocinitomix sp.]
MRILVLFLCFHATQLLANDGSFYSNGNQLIPIVESTISVKKEVLSIQRIENGYVRVTVSYIFDNPGVAKEILVGFEAPSPAGDVNGTPINRQHPYISNFSVVMNGLPIRYETAFVNEKDYYQDDTIVSLTMDEAKGEYGFDNYSDFYYVYHFNAPFKKGLNTIQHTYNFKMATSVMEYYSFGYILTAANRWANNGIDDFTLIIDLGDFQNFFLSKTFFKDKSDWSFNGKMLEIDEDLPPYLAQYKGSMEVFCKHGPLVFTKKDFHPNGELNINAVVNMQAIDLKAFDPSQHNLPFDLQSSSFISESISESAHKILRNLPYARRGYVFKTAFIRDFYESQKWYQPNPNYISNVDDLTENEKKWLKELIRP